MYSDIRDETELYYKKKKANPNLPKLTTGQLRLMTVRALARAWKKMLANPNVMIRSFQRTGISLRPDGSQDRELMHFQSCGRGIPQGLEI